MIRVEQYLNTVTGQMRSRRAQHAIAEELRAHIECQTADYISKGMDEETAEERALKDMGDPVFIGTQLDQVHRPRPAWGMLALIIALSIMSTCLWDYAGMRNLMPTLIGLAVMVLIYLLDYSFLAGKGRWFAGMFLAFYILVALCFPYSVRGKMGWFGVGRWHFSLEQLAYLYLPLYGAVLYDHRKEAYGGVGKCILWALPMPFLLLRLPDTSDALWIFLACMVLLSVAVGRGWFLVKGKRVLAGIWGTMIAAVLGMLVVIMQPGQNTFRDFQKARIMAFLNGAPNYMQEAAEKLLNSSRLFGAGNAAGQLDDQIAYASYDLATMRSDFAISLLSARCGKVVVAAAVVLLAVLIVAAFVTALRQSNELGAMIGCSVGIALGIQSVVYLLNHFGWVPYTSGYLPLLSYGGSGAVVSYALLGLVLSVYRYRDIPMRKDKKAGRRGMPA